MVGDGGGGTWRALMRDEAGMAGRDRGVKCLEDGAV